MEFQLKWKHSLYILTILLAQPTVLFGYETRNGLYIGNPGRKIQLAYVLDTRTAQSAMSCVLECGLTNGCASVSFESTTKTCILSDVTAIEIYTDEEDGWESYSKNVSDWLLAFRGPKGIGGDVYQSFVDRVGVTTNRSVCTDLTSTACQSNYRHPVLDTWAMGHFTKVRLSFYKGQTEAAYVMFDASGSDLTSWFTKERILNSTWPTSATDAYFIFSMVGSVQGEQRFLMMIGGGGCHLDTVYTIAILESRGFCSYDNQPSYPQFIYASTLTPGYPESESGTSNADFMAIFVKP